MQDFTLNELADFSRQEQDFLNHLLKNNRMVETPKMEIAPSKDSLDRIKAYNLAYSVRKTKNNHTIEMVLN